MDQVVVSTLERNNQFVEEGGQFSPYSCISNTHQIFFYELLLYSHTLDSCKSCWSLSRSDSILTASSSLTCEGSEMVFVLLPRISQDGWPSSEVMRLVCLKSSSLSDVIRGYCCLGQHKPTVNLSRAGSDGGSLSICTMGVRLQIISCQALRYLEMPPFFWITFREVDQTTWVLE